MKNLRNIIATYFAENYSRHRPNSLHSLFVKIAEIYLLDIRKDDNRELLYNIKGKDGYQIFAETIFTLMRMSDKGFIIFYRQGNPDNEFKNISYYKGDNVNEEKLSEDLARYIDEYSTCSIYVSDSISDFVENDFNTPELVEARKQTKTAQRTLYYAIATFFISLVAVILSVASIVKNFG